MTEDEQANTITNEGSGSAGHSSAAEQDLNAWKTGDDENRPDEVEVQREETHGAEAGRGEMTPERWPPQ